MGICMYVIHTFPVLNLVCKSTQLEKPCAAVRPRREREVKTLQHTEPSSPKSVLTSWFQAYLLEYDC